MHAPPVLDSGRCSYRHANCANSLNSICLAVTQRAEDGVHGLHTEGIPALRAPGSINESGPAATHELTRFMLKYVWSTSRLNLCLV